MGHDPLMAAIQELGVALDTLAAVAAHARIERDGLDVDDEIRDLLASIVRDVAGSGSGVPAVDPAAVGMIETLFGLGVDLIRRPQRAGGWDHTDPDLLQSIGRLSGSIAAAVAEARNQAPELAEALGRDGATFLDIGTGTGWLAIAMARTFPGLRVVGVDVFAPALELARGNVESTGLGDLIELRLQDAGELTDSAAFDVIWVALPFIPSDLVATVFERCRQALRPGGVVLPGTFPRSADPAAQRLTDLRTLRSGGHPWQPDELCAALQGAGFVDARHLDRRWGAPVELFLASLPT